MGKKQTQETYGQVKSDQSGAQTTNTQQQNQATNETQQAGGELNSANESGLKNSYSGLTTGQGVNTVGNNQVSTGRFDPIYSGYGDLAKTYSGLASNGGYSDGSKASIGSDISGLKNIGQTGGVSAASQGRAQGLGVYDQFAQNGGLSQADRANIKARGESANSAAAAGTQQELDRRRAVQGGFAPGFDASSRALQRDTSRNIADTDLNANLGVTQQVNANKLAGAQGASNSELGLQGMLTGNKLSGLTGAANTEMGMNNSIFGNQMSALSGQGNALAGQSGVAGSMANIDQGNINNNYQNAGILNNAMYTGLAGQNSLLNTDLSRYQGDIANGNNVVNSGVQNNLGYYGARNPLAMQPGVGGNIVSAIGSAAGAGAAALDHHFNTGIVGGNMTNPLAGNNMPTRG